MKILAPMKRVMGFNVKVRAKQVDPGIDMTNVKIAMNPFDENAFQQAVRLKETVRRRTCRWKST